MVKRMAPVEGTNWAGHDLELFPLLAIDASLALWCGMGSLWLLLVASPALHSPVWLAKPPFTPPLPPTHSHTPSLCWTVISAYQKKSSQKP